MSAEPTLTEVPGEAGRFADVAIRALDLLGATLGLVLLSPLLLVVAVAVKLDSPGRVFFRQRRLGKAWSPSRSPSSARWAKAPTAAPTATTSRR